MGRAKKFSFSKILFNGGATERDGDPQALLTKGGQFVINKVANHKYGFDGAFVDFTWDEHKRAFGWRKMNGLPLPENQWTKTMRILKADEKGLIKVPVGRIMKVIGVEKHNYKGLLIEEYNDVMESNKIYYVIIPEIKTNG